VVKRCLAKDPERRWHSARDVAIELDAIAGQAAVANDSSPAAVAPASPRGHGPPWLGARVPSRRRSRWLWAAAASAVLGASVWWLASRAREPEPPAAGAENAAAGPGTASAGAEIAAALPFQTLSDDPEIRQLAGGIPQEMSTRWAKSGWTLLTPSSSADGSADPCAAVRGRRVKVYHGSVGRFQSQVRVNAQLTACPEGNRLWGDTESYDATDLNAAQEKIAMWVLSSSAGYVWVNSPIDSLAVEYLRRLTRADNHRGLELAREAWRNRRDSSGGAALMTLLIQSLAEGWADPPSRTIEELVDVASALLAVAPQWGQAHLFVGYASLFSGDRERAVAAIERGVEMHGAAFPYTYAMLGMALALTERPEEAIAAIDEAVRLSPDDPERFQWENLRALAHFAAGRYQEARDAEQFALSFNTNNSSNARASAYQILAASLAHLGETKEARSALEHAVRLRPALTLEVAGVWYAASSAEHRERLLEGLRLAGLGEDGLVEQGAMGGDG
jgi:adenylate cyclase